MLVKVHHESTLKSEFPTEWQCWPEVKHTWSISLFLMAIFHFNISSERRGKIWKLIYGRQCWHWGEPPQMNSRMGNVWESPHGRGHEAKRAKSRSERCCWSNDKIFNVSWDDGGMPQSGSLMGNTENVYEQEDILKTPFKNTSVPQLEQKRVYLQELYYSGSCVPQFFPVELALCSLSSLERAAFSLFFFSCAASTLRHPLSVFAGPSHSCSPSGSNSC